MNLSQPQLESLISDYLSGKTDFAILIKGQWGSGKTYFIKHELIPFIEAKVLHSESEKQIPFEATYLSLYGISNPDEINRKLLFNLNPSFSKILALGATIGLNFIEKNIGKVDKEFKDLISLHRIPKHRVLIFDDLERIEIGVLNKVLGFINSFSEHDHLKVIILANEDELLKKCTDKEEYKRIKEKFIRFTYDFKSDVEAVFDHFAGKYPENFRKFLLEEKAIFCSIFKKSGFSNLRCVQFALDILQRIFKEIHIRDDIKQKDKLRCLRHIMNFSVIYSIQSYKGVTEEILGEMDTLDFRTGRISKGFLSMVFEKDKAKEIKPKGSEGFLDEIEELFIDHSGRKFYFFESVASYIKTGTLDLHKFKEEVNKIISDDLINEKTISEMNLSLLENTLILEQDKLEEVASAVMKDAFAGKYQLSRYPHVFVHIYNIGNTVSDKVVINEQTIPAIKKGMDIAVQTAKYSPNIRSSPFELPDVLKAINDYMQKLNDDLLEKLEVGLTSKFESALKSGDISKVEAFFNMEEIKDHAFLFGLDPIEFVDQYLQFSNEDKLRIFEMFRDLAGIYNTKISFAFKKEYDFWSKLNSLIHERLEVLPTTISSFHLKRMKMVCDSFIKYIEAYN